MNSGDISRHRGSFFLFVWPMERDLQIKRRSADATEEVNGDDYANGAGGSDG